MNDIMKIVWSLDESGLLIKSVRKKNLKWTTKKKKRGFLGMLSGNLGATLLLENILTDTGTIRAA